MDYLDYLFMLYCNGVIDAHEYYWEVDAYIYGWDDYYD